MSSQLRIHEELYRLLVPAPMAPKYSSCNSTMWSAQSTAKDSCWICQLIVICASSMSASGNKDLYFFSGKPGTLLPPHCVPRFAKAPPPAEHVPKDRLRSSSTALLLSNVCGCGLPGTCFQTAWNREWYSPAQGSAKFATPAANQIIWRTLTQVCHDTLVEEDFVELVHPSKHSGYPQGWNRPLLSKQRPRYVCCTVPQHDLSLADNLECRKSVQPRLPWHLAQWEQSLIAHMLVMHPWNLTARQSNLSNEDACRDIQTASTASFLQGYFKRPRVAFKRIETLSL